MSDKIFTALEDVAHASLEGKTGDDVEKLKNELKELNKEEIAEIQENRISAVKLTEILVVGIKLGDLVINAIKIYRKLP